MIGEAWWMARYGLRSVRRGVRQAPRRLAAWRRFWRSYRAYRALAPADQLPQLRSLYPCLGDDVPVTPIEPTYFYQHCWAFERIVPSRPDRHVDVGSHHAFVALLSKVVPVMMVDIRPLALPVDTLAFRQGSILDLPFADGSVASLSSLCVVEHIGLGRYGDPLDPRGTEKAIGELVRVLAPGGRLYLSLPVGEEEIVAFNAGRVLSLGRVRELVHPLRMRDERFIVRSSYQRHFEPAAPFEVTALLELEKQPAENG